MDSQTQLQISNACNFTDGGCQGLKGYTWSKESLDKMSLLSMIRESQKDLVEKFQTAKNAMVSKTYEKRLRITDPARKVLADISQEDTFCKKML